MLLPMRKTKVLPGTNCAFNSILSACMRGVEVPLKHAANSAAALSPGNASGYGKDGIDYMANPSREMNNQIKLLPLCL